MVNGLMHLLLWLALQPRRLALVPSRLLHQLPLRLHHQRRSALLQPPPFLPFRTWRQCPSEFLRLPWRKKMRSNQQCVPRLLVGQGWSRSSFLILCTLCFFGALTNRWRLVSRFVFLFTYSSDLGKCTGSLVSPLCWVFVYVLPSQAWFPCSLLWVCKLSKTGPCPPTMNGSLLLLFSFLTSRDYVEFPNGIIADTDGSCWHLWFCWYSLHEHQLQPTRPLNILVIAPVWIWVNKKLIYFCIAASPVINYD